MKSFASPKPGLTRAGLGAGATIMIGFGVSVWHTSTSAERTADERSSLAVTDALVPICIAQSKLDPDSAAKFAKMTTMITGYERRDYVMKAGWATTSTADGPNRDVAAACADVLIKPGQS